MKLKTVFARFYKSFNFDRLRKVHPKAMPKPWELIDNVWYPYIEVPLNPRIATIVGANESGKSHLLGAIEKAVTGNGFKQQDLCRYSPFFNVARGQTFWPHLGLEWVDLTEEESDHLKTAVKTPSARPERFAMFREGPNKLTIFLPDDEGGYKAFPFADQQAHSFGEHWLPRPFRIDPDIALPNSVPLDWLIDDDANLLRVTSRRMRGGLMDGAAMLFESWVTDPNTFTQKAPELYSKLNPIYSAYRSSAKDTEASFKSLVLARDLLVQLGNVEPKRLSDLSQAIRVGDDGHANALVARINDQLAKQLNFPKWWVQDRDFSLRVTPREFDLVFTVQDKTGTEYTFAERSSGLKYFLSYLVQSLSHRPAVGRSEILLMDEPDAYLSAEAQQDLLKIFAGFAEPESGATPIQVVYVTHSPFLIDKNHADRIRVLQKGTGFDGTKVIKNASQNHYEPLRSAFGAFVGETAFVGACNLLVEGVSDQIILAGISRLTRQALGPDNDTLDLNRLVIVPCGSAKHIPYMVHLIRGRDTEKPPVIALLDADPEGKEAAAILRSDRKIRRLIKEEFVLPLDEVPHLFVGETAPRAITIEDMLPAELAVEAANKYLAEVSMFREENLPTLSLEKLSEATGAEECGVYAQLSKAIGPNHHIDKIGFARAVVELCADAVARGKVPEYVECLLSRMTVIFRAVNGMKRKAEREATRERVGTLVDRHQMIFVRDNPEQATREKATYLLEQVEDVLDDSLEADAVKNRMVSLKRDFKLADDSASPVPNYEKFKMELGTLKDSFHLGKMDTVD